MIDLELIYKETLRRCSPQDLVRRVASPDMPAHVVAIGKCAGPLLDGFARVVDVESALAVIPTGYPVPVCAGEDTRAPKVVVARGGHPQIDDASFRAGELLLRYVDEHDEITFLISGGGSACVEAPLRPFFDEQDLIDVNTRLITAGISISQINTVRKHLSAIKGGRLGARVHHRSVTLVYSDVSTGDFASVASGPTLPDTTTRADAIEILERVGGCHRIVTTLRDDSVPETVKEIGNSRAWLIADNETLVDTAAHLVEEAGGRAVRHDGQIETDAQRAAVDLASRATLLQHGDVLVAGGEPTVVVRGSGRGGRCLELGVRFAMAISTTTNDLHALFASSDGVDGNSGVAGVTIDAPTPIDTERAEAMLRASDSLILAGEIGRPIIIVPTGNNLRDLYLVARG